MGKVLLLWELDRTRTPVDPKERIAAWTMMTNMVKDELKSGGLKEWGMFTAEMAGYAIREGTDEEIAIATGKYEPYVKFKAYSILSVSQAEEVVKALSQG